MYRKMFLLLGVLLLLNGCATVTKNLPEEQVKVYVVEQGNIKYSLFLENESGINILPILEKNIIQESPQRLFWKVSIKKRTRQMLLIKAFIQAPKINGHSFVGSFSGFKDSEVVIEIDLPLDLINQAVVAWFTIEGMDGHRAVSKKKKFILRGK